MNNQTLAISLLPIQFVPLMRATRRQRSRDQLVIVPKMEPWKKILFALFVSMLCFAITKGDPRRENALNNIQITDEKIEYIVQTTIAIQTKTIRKRIVEEYKGIWKYVQYVSAPKWAEIQVQLKTRIGIKLNSITYDKAYNNVHIDFGGPQVLDRSYVTRMIQSSDGYFSKWSIASFEEHKEIFLQELIENQSNNLIDIFKSNKKQVQRLEGQYKSKVLATLNSRYNQFDPQIMVWKLNQYLLGMVSRVIPSNYLPSINSSYFYTKQIQDKSKDKTPQPQDKFQPKDKVWNQSKRINQEHPQVSRRRFSQKQRLQRQKIKQRLFNKS